MDAGIASVASLFADPTRATVLSVLMSGRAHTAGELARVAGVSPSTMTSHLGRLLDAGAVTIDVQGRHRYYRLVDDRLAPVFEALRNAAPTPPVRSLRQSQISDQLRHARTCYDHLAGRVGVAVTEALVGEGHLRASDGAYELSDRGGDLLVELGVDLDAARGRRRRFAYPCLDWSERTHHLAGSLGAALLDALVARELVRRRPGSRAVALTEAGSSELERRLGVAIGG